MQNNKVNISKHRLVKLILISTLIFFCLCQIVYAAPPDVDPSRFSDTAAGFQHFYLNLVPYIQKVVTDSVVTDFSTTLWKFFAVILIVWTMTIYVMRGADFSELFTVIFMIMITHILMINFDSITSALWSWSEAFATGIQKSAIGVSDEFFAPRYIWNLVTSFSWSAENFLLHPQNVFAAIMLSLASVGISVLAFFASVWALWGYSIAKIIGLMFVPTLLFDWLSWLFDGWLRFFFGFLLFNVIAKANLMIAIIALSAYFGLPANQICSI